MKAISPAGLYIHFPFCKKKCSYCDFYSITDLSQIEPYIESLIREMSFYRDTGLHFDTIYFGGGTPSVGKASMFSRIIEHAYKSFDISPQAEITFEANPETVTKQKMKDLHRSGINRVSIGVQSFQDDYLKFLGRIHSVQDALNAFESTRKAGIENISIDLIYGLPDQTNDLWLKDLNRAVELSPEHISCYMLTCETGTLLYDMRQQGLFVPAKDDCVGTLFEVTSNFLKSNGYIHYEVSNFAQSENLMSHHNRKYWYFAPYIGLGASAHSFLAGTRFWNHRCVTKYISDLNAGLSPVAGHEILTRTQRLIETVLLGLRTTKGINFKDIEDQFDVSVIESFGEYIRNLEQDGYIKIDAQCCMLTLKGMKVLDCIVSAFVDSLI